MENKEIRRTNLEHLVEKHGGIKALSDLVDVDPTYIGNIIRKVKTPSGRERGLGDDIARRVEEKLGLQTGWMDSIHLEDEEEERLLEHFRRVDEQGRAHILEAARYAARTGHRGAIAAEPPPGQEYVPTRKAAKKFRKGD